MSVNVFIQTPNSVQNQLNATPQTLFLTQNIADPIVQQNFEQLNKIVAKILNGQIQIPANIVFGQVLGTGQVATQFSGTSIQTPGALQVQITTGGNPVRVKVAPAQYAGAGNSLFSLGVGVSDTILEAGFGWTRIDASGNQTTVGIVQVELDFASGDITLFAMSLPLFEMDDVVPAGTYTYQFFLQLGDSHQVLNIANIQAVAYELG